MTLPRYMTSTTASASKISEAKTPLRRVQSSASDTKTQLRRVPSSATSESKSAIRRVQSSASSISKIPRLETVNLRQLKPLLEQKADPNRAQELAKAWSRPRGILKPSHRSFLPVPATILENAAASDDDDDDCDDTETVDQIVREEALLVRKLVNGHPSTPRPIGECDESSTPKPRLHKNQGNFAANLLAAAGDRLELESIIILTPPAPRLIIVEKAQPQIALDKTSLKIEQDCHESMIDTFYEAMLAQYIIDTCREIAYEENLLDSKTLLMRTAATTSSSAAAVVVIEDTPVKQKKTQPKTPKTAKKPKTPKTAKKPKTTPTSPTSPRKTRSKTIAQIDKPIEQQHIKDDTETETWIIMKNEAVQTVDDL